MGAPQTAYWVDSFKGTSIGTGTTKTQLNGGNDYIVQGLARSIVAVRPKLVPTAATANQAQVATLKIESADLKLGDYEVFAPPIGAGLGTNEQQFADESRWFPCNFPCGGGESVKFYGTAQRANTAAPLMSVDILLSDTRQAPFVGALRQWDEVTDYDQMYQAKLAGINYGGGPTATGTAAASVATDGGLNLGGANKLIKAMYGLLYELSSGAPDAAKVISGTFAANESALAINPLKMYAEPILPFLGTTTTGDQVHLTRLEALNIKLKTNAKILSTFTLDAALSNAANFECGYLYQDTS